MSKNDYVVKASLIRTEYPDVIEDITQYEGDARDERIKELLRLGLQAIQAQEACAAAIAKAKLQ